MLVASFCYCYKRNPTCPKSYRQLWYKPVYASSAYIISVYVCIMQLVTKPNDKFRNPFLAQRPVGWCDFNNYGTFGMPFIVTPQRLSTITLKCTNLEIRSCPFEYVAVAAYWKVLGGASLQSSMAVWRCKERLLSHQHWMLQGTEKRIHFWSFHPKSFTKYTTIIIIMIWFNCLLFPRVGALCQI